MDEVVIVEDAAIIDAVLWLLSNAKMVIEPSGAATVAAALGGRVATEGAGGRHRERRQRGHRRRSSNSAAPVPGFLPPEAGRPKRENISMPIERFEMERMQSTWENVVDYDMSESGVRPLTLRELVDDGVRPRRVPRPAARLQPVERHDRAARAHRRALSRAPTVDHVEVTNGTSEANYLLALSLLRAATRWRCEVPNYMQIPGVPRSLGADGADASSLQHRPGWEPDWDEFERARHSEDAARLPLESQQPDRRRCSPRPRCAHRRRCEQTGAWLLADEVYLGAEIDRRADAELLGHERSRDRDQRAVEGVRHSGCAHRLDRRPRSSSSPSAGRSTTTSRSARTRSRTASRGWRSRRQPRACYARTRAILQHNLPIAREWVERVRRLSDLA